MTIIISAVAVIAVCALAVAGAVLKYYGKQDALDKLKGYQGIALRIFQKVEAIIPDSYGAVDSDPVLGKSIHKLDTFLKEFGEFYEKTEGGKLTPELKSELRVWVQTWADRQKQVAATPQPQPAPKPTTPELVKEDADA